jgi:hypothetical protein
MTSLDERAELLYHELVALGLKNFEYKLIVVNSTTIHIEVYLDEDPSIPYNSRLPGLLAQIAISVKYEDGKIIALFNENSICPGGICPLAPTVVHPPTPLYQQSPSILALSSY